MAFTLKGSGRSLSEGFKFVKCGECKRSGKPMAVGGQGKRKILVLFEQPSAAQINRNSWFAGGDASVLQVISGLGLNLMEDLWVTAVLPCAGGVREATFRYEACIQKLRETILDLKPKLIIAVGPGATGAVLRLYNSRHFAENYTSAQYTGKCIPLVDKDWPCWLAPVASDREIHANKNQQVQNVAKDWLRRNIEYAIERSKDTPIPVLPNVELLYETDAICSAIDDAFHVKYVSFDYETNRLHPEYPNAKILSCAITLADSDQIFRTVAFPMASMVVRQKWCQFLQSSVFKIGANIKFEHRWSCVNLGVPVVNWKWDICVGSRVLDCIPGNSGLKYTAFVNFGVIGYDDSVAPYMKDDENGCNGLSRMDFTELLTYNGYDAVYTYLCAKEQHDILHFAF